MDRRGGEGSGGMGRCLQKGLGWADLGEGSYLGYVKIGDGNRRIASLFVLSLFAWVFQLNYSCLSEKVLLLSHIIDISIGKHG